MITHMLESFAIQPKCIDCCSYFFKDKFLIISDCIIAWLCVEKSLLYRRNIFFNNREDFLYILSTGCRCWTPRTYFLHRKIIAFISWIKCTTNWIWNIFWYESWRQTFTWVQINATNLKFVHLIFAIRKIKLIWNCSTTYHNIFFSLDYLSIS